MVVVGGCGGAAAAAATASAVLYTTVPVASRIVCADLIMGCVSAGFELHPKNARKRRSEKDFFYREA